MKNIHKIGHPLFISSVILLLVNDWYLKLEYPNEITGKLSDFAGLFAFPFLLSVLFPSKKMIIHVLTGVLFIVWKSGYSQPLIEIYNSIGIPIGRTVDFSDNIALVSVLISFISLRSNTQWTLHPLIQRSFLFISCLAFIATSMPPREKRLFVDINKEYEFPYSKQELAARLNMVQIKELHKLKSLKNQVDFDSATNSFHFRGQTDTVAVLVNTKNIQSHDTISFKSSFAELYITGNNSKSKITLLSVYKHIPRLGNKDYRERAIKEFEKRIVKGIKNL